MSSGADHQKEPSSLVTPNKPQKNRINWPRRLSFNRQKPNPRWRLSWMSSRADHRKEPSSLVTPNKPQKNRINRPRRLSYNWWKPNVYGHRRIGHDIMPQTFYDRGHKNMTELKHFFMIEGHQQMKTISLCVKGWISPSMPEISDFQHKPWICEIWEKNTVKITSVHAH
jgi:hypothetical protein